MRGSADAVTSMPRHQLGQSDGERRQVERLVGAPPRARAGTGTPWRPRRDRSKALARAPSHSARLPLTVEPVQVGRPRARSTRRTAAAWRTSSVKGVKVVAAAATSRSRARRSGTRANGLVTGATPELPAQRLDATARAAASPVGLEPAELHELHVRRQPCVPRSADAQDARRSPRPQLVVAGVVEVAELPSLEVDASTPTVGLHVRGPVGRAGGVGQVERVHLHQRQAAPASTCSSTWSTSGRQIASSWTSRP